MTTPDPGAPQEIHYLARVTSTRGGKHVAFCWCGWKTTPRTTQARAKDALLKEHGQNSRGTCVLCGQLYDLDTNHRLIALDDVLDTVQDPELGRPVWQCRDISACRTRAQLAGRPARKTAVKPARVVDLAELGPGWRLVEHGDGAWQVQRDDILVGVVRRDVTTSGRRGWLARLADGWPIAAPSTGGLGVRGSSLWRTRDLAAAAIVHHHQQGRPRRRS